MTCEQCGADAVVAGVCQNCGWRVPADRAGTDPNAALQAETREADIPVRPRRPVAARTFGPPTPYPPAAAPGDAAPITPRMAHRSGISGAAGGNGAYGAPGPSTTRFCGTCGAQIEAGQLFCGQCGAAVASFEGSAVNHPTMTNHPGYSSPRYPEVDDEPWSPADQDAPTEQWTPIQGGNGRGATYRGGAPAYVPAVPVPGLSRETRVLLGILCIVGALISGAGALILAFLK